MELNITDIKETVRLIKRVNCQSYALISETAKEMGAKKTQVMMFIEQNPKLFKLGEVTKGNKSQGLAILEVYSEADQNPDTQECLDRKIREWDHKIHVGEMTYYGHHEFWYFPEEMSKSKASLYRNTLEKIRELEEKGILKKTDQCYGGLGDCSKTSVYLCNEEALQKLAEAGWTTDFEEVKSCSKSY